MIGRLAQWNGKEWVVMGDAEVTTPPPGSTWPGGYVSITTATTDDPVTGYDLGDLQQDIDNQCGPAIERAAHRYLPKPMAQDIRRKFIRQIADTVVAHDKQQGNAH